MNGTDVIAVVALAISAASAVAAGISLYLGFRESSRRDEEIRLLRDEAGRRVEELTLLRQQVEAEHADRVRTQQASISVPEGPVIGRNTGHGIEYDVPVQNTGPYIARGVGVELHVEGAGTVAGTGLLDRALVPGDKGVVKVMTPLRPGRYTIFVGWIDGRGPNLEGRRRSRSVRRKRGRKVRVEQRRRLGERTGQKVTVPVECDRDA